MKSLSHPKGRISAVVPVSVIKALDIFKKTAALRSRSAAAAQALADWVREFQREARMQKVVEKYSKAYRTSADWEVGRAEKMLPLMESTRKSP